MASVAIIHAPEDALPARALAEKLRAANLNVTLEQPAGEAQRAAARDAKVTIALWSPRSVAQPGTVDDATFARGKTKLVHATMQNAAAPDSFRGDPTVNLTGWRGEDNFQAWTDLAKLVTDRAGVPPLPPPAPLRDSGFFQPGKVVNPDSLTSAAVPRLNKRQIERRDAEAAAAAAARGQPAPRAQAAAPRPQPAPAPRPQTIPRAAPASFEPEPRRSGGGGNGMMMGIIVFVVVALAGGGGYFWWSQQQNTASTTAWDQVEQDDAGAIRAFLAGDPGEFRDDAQAALATLEERTFEAAMEENTIPAFEAFLNEFPESDDAMVARGRIEELRIAAAEAPPEGTETPPTEDATAVDPDLVPPDSAPATDGGGPSSIAPPAAPETNPAPTDLPTN